MDTEAKIMCGFAISAMLTLFTLTACLAYLVVTEANNQDECIRLSPEPWRCLADD